MNTAAAFMDRGYDWFQQIRRAIRGIGVAMRGKWHAALAAVVCGHSALGAFFPAIGDFDWQGASFDFEVAINKCGNVMRRDQPGNGGVPWLSCVEAIGNAALGERNIDQIHDRLEGVRTFTGGRIDIMANFGAGPRRRNVPFELKRRMPGAAFTTRGGAEFGGDDSRQIAKVCRVASREGDHYGTGSGFAVYLTQHGLSSDQETQLKDLCSHPWADRRAGRDTGLPINAPAPNATNGESERCDRPVRGYPAARPNPERGARLIIIDFESDSDTENTPSDPVPYGPLGWCS
jgi:hypothetical protein